MDRRALLSATGALALASLTGCLAGDTNPIGNSDDISHSPNVNPEIPTEGLQALAYDNADFGLTLYRTLAAEDQNNLFLSPYSISVALAMTYAGARGTTAEEMADVLRFTDDEVHEAFASLHHELEAREETEDGDNAVDAFKLRIANALWGRKGESFSAEFLDHVADYYGGGLEEADFAADPDGERERINDWVAQQTEDRIEDLLPPGSIDPSTVLVLTNAIYFLASWESEFDPDDTHEGSFTTLAGEEETVSLMHQDIRTNYAKIGGAEAIELPYVGGEVSMVLVLPEDGTFESFDASFEVDVLFDLFSELSDHTGSLVLPKFEIETEFALSEVLKDLGMETPFASDADFSGMFENGNAWIDDVYHDAFVTIDEEGTEAAAATAVTMMDSAPPDWGELRFDRPFLFCIRDRPTNSVLFLGRVVDPST